MESGFYIIRVGGLSLYSELEVVAYAFVAYRAQSCVLQYYILRYSGIYGMDSNFDKALEGL